MTKVTFEETRPLTSQALIVRVYSGFLPGSSPLTFKFSGTLPYSLTRNGLADVALPGTSKFSSEYFNQGRLRALPKVLNSIFLTCPLSSVISI